MQNLHDRPAENKTDDPQKNTENEEEEDRSGNGALHPFIVTPAEQLAHENRSAGSGSDGHADKDIRQRTGSSDSGKGILADKAADNHGVGDIVNLLKQVAEDHRQRKEQKRFHRVFINQIFIFTGISGQDKNHLDIQNYDTFYQILSTDVIF